MAGRFEPYAWNAQLYPRHQEIMGALDRLGVMGKKIKHVHVIGTAENMEAWSHVLKMRNILFDHAGIPYEDIDSGAYPYCDMVRFPCEVRVCEPVVFVFYDNTTLEILPHDFSGLLMSTGQIGADIVDGTNWSDFDSDRLFNSVKGHSIQKFETIVQTRKSQSGRSADQEQREEITYQFWLDGESGFFFRQLYGAWYLFGLTLQNSFINLGNRITDVSYREWKNIRKQLTQIKIVEGRGHGGCFLIGPERSEKNDDCSVPECRWEQISIDEETVVEFLYFFLKDIFDEELNRACRDEWDSEGFDWYGCNYFTYESVRGILDKMDQFADLLENDYHNPLLDGLKQGFRASSFDQDYYERPAKDRLPDDVLLETNRGIAVDFYRRFSKRMRAMMEYAPQYHLIYFSGP